MIGRILRRLLCGARRRRLTPEAARKRIKALATSVRAYDRRRSPLDRLLGRKSAAQRRAEAALADARARLDHALREDAALGEKRLRRLERSPAVRANQGRLKERLIAEADPWGLGLVRCFYCRRRVRARRAHIDHRRPVSKGGTNERSNTVLACARCNLAKGGMTEAAFRRRMRLPRG